MCSKLHVIHRENHAYFPTSKLVWDHIFLWIGLWLGSRAVTITDKAYYSHDFRNYGLRNLYIYAAGPVGIQTKMVTPLYESRDKYWALLTLHSVIYFGQHLLKSLFITWRHDAITCIYVRLTSIKPCRKCSSYQYFFNCRLKFPFIFASEQWIKWC